MKHIRILKKVIIYGLIAAIVIIIGLAVDSGNMKNKYADYTTYNTGENGVKALYLLTEKMGYNTSRFKRPARFIPNGSTLVIIKPDWYGYMDDEQETKYLKEWVRKGNTLVFIDDDNEISDTFVSDIGASYKENIESYGEWSLYTVGDGKLYLGNSSDNFTNSGLKLYNPGISFINILDLEGNRDVLFNEYYHGMGTQGVTIWDIIGPAGILVFIQLVFGLFILFFVLSRRLGKPVTEFEIIKRKENENIYALSNIYTKAKADAIVLENILENFKKELSKFLGFTTEQGNNELIIAAAGNKYLSEMGIQGLFERCAYFIKSGGGSNKELVYLVQWIEKIRKGIK